MIMMISFVRDHELFFSDLSYSMILDLWIVSHWNHRDSPEKKMVASSLAEVTLDWCIMQSSRIQNEVNDVP